ncbi:MAG: hypothetical protein ACYSR5_12555 [Planctomycetota bacterium]|jgi:hypothetical protein
MSNTTSFIRILAIVLFALGCEPSQEASVFEPPPLPPSRTLTLPNDQLIALDWHGQGTIGAKVTQKRDVAGPGVEFDIYFPTNKPGHRSINYVSSGKGGFGALLDADLRGYEAFALNFTLVAIDGSSSPELAQRLIVGPLIGPTAGGQAYEYKPATLAFDSGRTTADIKMPISTHLIRQIGFHAHMDDPNQWNPAGTMVTLRIEPADDAGPVPCRAAAITPTKN